MTTKIPMTVYLTPAVAERLRTLAAFHHRSRSMMIEILILEEEERTNERGNARRPLGDGAD